MLIWSADTKRMPLELLAVAVLAVSADDLKVTGSGQATGHETPEGKGLNIQSYRAAPKRSIQSGCNLLGHHFAI